MIGNFSPDLFQNFCNYYVNGFYKTLETFKDLGIQKVFYPSSVFIDEYPANMGEYVTAKAAGETLCMFIEKTQKSITVYKPRLPKLSTDQTATVSGSNIWDPVPVILEHLRLFHRS